MPTEEQTSEPLIDEYTGPRDALRDLFALAEDSPTQLDSYLHEGRVLVARRGASIIGHLQLVNTAQPDTAEVKNMAVREAEQRRGVGAQLVRAALHLAAADGYSEMIVATAAADIGNLRFYQRQGFRFRSIQRDAFDAVAGYPADISIDGIPLRDRVWLDRPV
jgi:ribosomal protein S18 acetylase RimI-like enzyme